MFRYFFVFFLLFISKSSLVAQLTGSVESNSALYIDDKKIKLEQIEAENRFRSNNYLRLDYTKNNFKIGTQIESYETKALLNYSPKYEGTKLANYYANYKNDSAGIDVTVGHFYDQFGSGLVLRNWEDRQLGIANSLVGAKIKFAPTKTINFTALYGKQRNGFAFDYSNGTITGLNTDVNLSTLLKAKKVKYDIGFSYVNKHEKYNVDTLKNNTYLTSARANFSYKGFNVDVEYAFKSKDALVEFSNERPEFQFDGDAYLLNLGYSKKGVGINATFRRLENFGAFTQRNLQGNIYNQGILNYIPALTKQYDYSLTNIYVYAAQPYIVFEPNRNKAGEIGGQIDLFYKIKKETVLGGKYGTNISINISQWQGLKGRYEALERKYEANFLGSGQKYYNDFGVEIRKKWSPKLSSVYTYLNQFYNALYIEEATGTVKANTVVIENILRLKKNNSIKFQLQHQWANALFKNWAAAQFEFNFKSNFSIFAIDLYNYGNNDTLLRTHFYNGGFAYKFKSTRVQASYGRQRGGLICVGGVCRFVPESAGLNLNINVGF